MMKFRILDKKENRFIEEPSRVCFPGEVDRLFWNDFFRDRIYQTRVAVLENKTGQIVSFTQIWPVEVLQNGSHFTVSYLFDVGTMPDFRRQGYRDLLLQQVFYQLKEEGQPWVFLAPADETIWSSLGFDKRFVPSPEDIQKFELDDGIEICLVKELVPGSFSSEGFHLSTRV